MYEVLLTRASGSGQKAGSWKAVIRDDCETQELSGRLEGKNQHQVAIIAACKCFEAVPEGCAVAFHTANEVLVKTMTGEYERQANMDLWSQLDEAVGQRAVRWEYRSREALAGRLRQPHLVAEAGDVALAQLGDAYAFLPEHDRVSVVSAYCLLERCPELPEYSAVVMPIARAYEGFLRELCLKEGLATAEELANPSFALGTVFDAGRPATKAFKKRGRRHKGMLDTLKGDLQFSRHFLMHSDPAAASRVESLEEARKHIVRLSQTMKAACVELVTGK